MVYLKSEFDGTVVEPDQPRPFVKSGDTGFKIRGERFFTGDFLQTSGHFPQSLCPAGSGVRQQQNVQAHLPVIFGKGNRRVNRGFTGSHRHRTGIADDDRTVHQTLAGPGVGQMRKLAQDFHHFTGAFTACRDNHHIGFRMLADRVLKHGLARTERSGCTERAALRHREEGINDPLLGDERVFRQKFFLVTGYRCFDRPFLNHGDRAFFAAVIDHFRHRVVNPVFPGWRNRNHFPAAQKCERQHDVMGENSFGNGTDPVAGEQHIARFGNRGEIPFRFTVQRIKIYAALKKETGFFRQTVQRVL